ALNEGPRWARLARRSGLVLIALVSRRRLVPRLAQRARDDALGDRLAEPELGVNGAQQEQLAEQVEPRRQQEKQRELRAVGVKAMSDPRIKRERERQHLDGDAREQCARKDLPYPERAVGHEAI